MLIFECLSLTTNIAITCTDTMNNRFTYYSSYLCSLLIKALFITYQNVSNFEFEFKFKFEGFKILIWALGSGK